MAARDTERYYWLKLHKDFFKRHDITVIEDMPNGKDYVLFYLKLMLESVDHEGALRFSDTIPYSETMLASVTHTNVDVVRSALKVLTELGMVEVFDDKTLFMTEVAKLLDSETYAARRKREQRKIEGAGDNVPRLSPDCPQDIEIDPEIEKEPEKEQEKEDETFSDENVCRPQDVRQVFDAWQSLGIQRLRKIPDATTSTGKMLRARIKDYGISSVLEAVEIVRNSDFLMGKVKDFQITFDWFVRPNNFLNIVNGKYDNRTGRESDTRHGREMKETYNTIERWAEERANDSEGI